MAIKIEKVIRTAEKYVAKGKLEAAIKEYRKVLAENPNDANILNRVGDLYARIERFDEAVKLFSQIAEKYARDGFHVKAIAIYKKIIKLDPTALQVYERLAELYAKQGLMNEARTQYQVLAGYYEKHDNPASAITIYQRMAEIEPENPQFHLKLAELYESQQLDDKAVRSYSQLADLLLVNGSIVEATRVYLKALEIGAKDIEFVRAAIASLHEGGHTAAANKVLDKAVELNPETRAIGHELGLLAGSDPVPPAAVETEEEAPIEVRAEEISFDVDEETPADDTRQGTGDTTVMVVEEEEETFTFSLDDDDIPETQVQPPVDMPETAAEEATASFSGEETSAVADLEEPEVEVDWGMDDLGEAPDEGSVEFDLGAPEIDLEVDEPIEIEVEAAPGAPAAGAPAAGAPAAGEPGPTAVRHEEDLLAEAKVFAKYGLAEKAFDRLQELLVIGSEHLEALQLIIGIELETGRHEEALAHARTVRRLARASGDAAPWTEVEGQLAQVGLALEAEEEAPAVEAAPEVSVPAAVGEVPEAVLEVVEEPLVPEPVFEEPIVPEPVLEMMEEPLVPEPILEEPVVPEPVLEEPVVPEPVAPEPVAPEPVAVEPEVPEPVLEEPVFEEPLAPGPVTTPAAEPPSPVPRPTKTKASRISQLLDDLKEFETPRRIRPKAPPPAAPGPLSEVDLESLVRTAMADSTPASSFAATVESSSVEPPSVEPAPVEPPSVEPAAVEPSSGEPPAAAADQVVSLADELGLSELDDEMEEIIAAHAADAEETFAETSAGLDETGMSWLDEVSDTGSMAQNEAIFDEEDDFFDLASELEAELSDSDEEIEPLETAGENLQDIIDGFKQGVAENLSAEDYDTHFNLGIAYREMGLLDEAIGEFQLASKDDRYVVECASMLGLCFLEKGLPELAVRWYQKGLESPAVTDQQSLGLLYDMGAAYEITGDNEKAYKTFVEIYGMNSNYRDVSSKVQELSQAR